MLPETMKDLFILLIASDENIDEIKVKIIIIYIYLKFFIDLI